MARDCPDRQRGQNWRNDRGPPGRPGAGLGHGDAVDQEYEQLMQELGGSAPPLEGGRPQGRIESGPSQDGGYGDNYGGRDRGYNVQEEVGPDGRPLKPWQRGPKE